MPLLISLIVYLMDYEEPLDDSSISFLSPPGSPFFSESFSQGHNSISQCGNIQGGYCSFGYCILKCVWKSSQDYRPLKNIIMEQFLNSSGFSKAEKPKERLLKVVFFFHMDKCKSMYM